MLALFNYFSYKPQNPESRAEQLYHKMDEVRLEVLVTRKLSSKAALFSEVIKELQTFPALNELPRITQGPLTLTEETDRVAMLCLRRCSMKTIYNELGLNDWVASSENPLKANYRMAASEIATCFKESWASLILRNLALRDLPEKLDKLSIRYLDVTGNRLNFLRNLPQTLQNLNINHNRFTTLPHLPPALSELHCEGNDLIGWHALPPGSLTFLFLEGHFAMLSDMGNELWQN